MSEQHPTQINQFCTYCGVQLSSGSFCHSCGNPIVKSNTIDPTKHANTATGSLGDQDDLNTFVGKNADYYIRKWSTANNPNKFVSWNWAAFLGGIFWLSYRKMYLYMILLALFISLFDYILFSMLYLFLDTVPDTVPDELITLIILTLMLLFGIFGNALYYRHSQKKISRIGKIPLGAEAKHLKLKTIGGIKPIAIIFPVLVFFVYSFLSAGIERLVLPVTSQPLSQQVDRKNPQTTEKINLEETKTGVLSNLKKAFDRAGWSNKNATLSNITINQYENSLDISVFTGSFYFYAPNLDNHFYHDIAMYSFIYNANQLFQDYPDIDSIRLIFWDNGVDSYGNKTQLNNFIVSMDKQTFDKVNWSEIEKRIAWDSYDPSIFSELAQH